MKALGYRVSYNKSTKKMTAINDETGQKIVLTAGKKTATVNGKTKKLSATTKLIGSSSLYISPGTIKTITGKTAKWSKKSKTITITDTVANGHTINHLVTVK